MARDRDTSLRGGTGSSTGPLFPPPRDIKPRKIATLNSLATDDDDDDSTDKKAGHVATAAATAAPEKPVKTRKSDPKATVPPAPEPTPEPKKKSKKKKEPESKVTLLPPGTVAAAFPEPPPGYVPPAQQAATLTITDLYSKIGQRNVWIAATCILLTVMTALMGVGLFLGVPPAILLAVACFTFLGGCFIHGKIRGMITTVLDVPAFVKIGGLVLGTVAGLMLSAIGLFIVAVPLAFMMILYVGLHTVYLERRLAESGTAELQVLEVTQGVTGGFDAAATVPPTPAPAAAPK